MFIRKLYYNLETGAVLDSHMRQGSVRMTTFEEDVVALPSLFGCTEANTGVMVWTTPDAELEQNFTTATSVSVDVAQTPHTLVFDFTPIEIPIETNDTEVYEAALTELGVELAE